MKRKVGEIWKEGIFYKVQFPKGIASFRSLKMAEKWKAQLQKENQIEFK